MRDGTILDYIGNTPLVAIKGFHNNPHVHIFAKLEGSNPGGSVKDRTAKYMITRAEQEGKLKPGAVLVEATSGNTGIALAMIGALKGYRVIIYMPESASLERRSVIQAYGGEVVITPDHEGMDGALARVEKIAQENAGQVILLNQYANEANILAHYETTGPEIYQQTRGEVDCVVAGMGTSGTIMGIGSYLKERRPGIRIVGIEHPPGACVQGLKSYQTGRVPQIFSRDALDEVIVIPPEEAKRCTVDLARRSGIFAGLSSGAALAGSLAIAKTMKEGTIVTIFADRGDRYLTNDIFPSICSMCREKNQ